MKVTDCTNKIESSKITSIKVFNLITEIEKKYNVNKISLEDGTKIWNLLRIFLYSYPLEKINYPKINSYKKIFYILKDSFTSINIPSKNVKICGFSSSMVRKYKDEGYYDIYIDPLNDILGEDFVIFEWSDPEGYQRNHKRKNYYTNSISMHLSIFTEAFWNIGFCRISGKQNFSIISRNILDDIIDYFSNLISIDNKRIKKDVYNHIAVFLYMKKFFVKFLNRISPLAVIIICGYSGFHMALSQACKELNIPSIELQHGIITKFHPGYVKAIESKNKDCIPEYLLTYGNVFSDIVRNGKLFEPEKVCSIGFAYMDEVKKSSKKVDNKLKDFLKNFSTNLIVTSQWIVADEVKKFVINVVKKLGNSNKNIGIVFKPHPRDLKDYSDMSMYDNIFLANKYDDIYEILKVVDIHSTVYSTSGLEALAFGKPNIFIDVGTSIKHMFDVIDDKSSFIVNSPEQFIDRLDYILSDYENISKDTFRTAEKFFNSDAKNNFEKFLNSIEIRV